MIEARVVVPVAAWDLVLELKGYTTLLIDKLEGLPPDEAYCFAMTLEGRLIGVAGVIPEHESAGTAFTVLTDDVDLAEHVHRLVRIHRLHMKMAFKALGLRRIHSFVPVGDQQSVKWMQLIGFEAEAILKQCLPDGSDAVLLYQLNPEVNHGMGSTSSSRVLDVLGLAEQQVAEKG